MCNEVKNAIDTGLAGLCVTERDVAAILSRARTERAARAARQECRWGLVLALAAVLLVLVAGAGVRLLSGWQEITPLQQNQTAVPSPGAGEFLPVGGEAAEPEIRVSANEAVSIAERHVYEEHDGAAVLQNAAVYEPACRWVAQERDGNTFWANFWEVRFDALNEYATAYVLRIGADDGRVLTCREQRGVGDGHTAQEILAGYARIYGTDRRTWTQAQLRTYAKTLRRAQTGTHTWEDFLYQLCTYPDVHDSALPKETVLTLTAERLNALAAAHDEAAGIAWTSLETTGSLRARYIAAYPNAVWKVAADQTGVMTDGCPVNRTLLIEVDSVTGEPLGVNAVDTLYAPWYESFTQSVIDAQLAVTTAGGEPSWPEKDAYPIAAAYVLERWGETRDLADPALFRVEALQPETPDFQILHHLRFTSVAPGETTCYELLIDWYGQVLSAYRLTLPEGFAGEPFLPTVPSLYWEQTSLEAAQALASQSPERELPEMQVFLNTRYLTDKREGVREHVDDLVCDALHVRSAVRRRAILIDAAPNPVWKVAMQTDQGDLLVEMDSVTEELLSVMRVESLLDSWYLPFTLTADLKAAGIPLIWDVQQHSSAVPVEDHGATGGMRIDHLYGRFRQLYGPNMGAWTQAQLRSFQRLAVLSEDQDYDLSVPCLRRTVYPDVPANAITRTQAMLSAADFVAQHVSLPVAEMAAEKAWVLHGGVLLGTEGTPVWKVCFGYDGPQGPRIFCAEVDCMTGQVRELHEDAPGTGTPGACYDNGTPANLWFREIVLEETIRECEETWVCRGNG